MMGWPILDRWTRIWCVLPVRGFISRSEIGSPLCSSFVSFNTFHFVTAARLYVRTAALSPVVVDHTSSLGARPLSPVVGFTVHCLGAPDVRIISAMIIPSLSCMCPYTQARYVFRSEEH